MQSNNDFPSKSYITERIKLVNARKPNIIDHSMMIFLWSMGILTLIWALINPQFRDAEGFLMGDFCLVISFGIAFFIIGWGISSHQMKFAYWVVTALLGQAAALQMIEAGKIMRYQHYLPFERLKSEIHPLLLIFLIVQTITLIYEIIKHRSKIYAFLKRYFKTWQLLGIGLVFLVPSATVSPDVTRYVSELVFAAYIQIINLGTVILAVSAIPKDWLPTLKNRFERLFGAKDELNDTNSKVIDRFIIFASVWVILIAAILSIFSYQRHPHIPDEVAYIYHARFLANGKLTMPSPPVSEGFEIYLMQYDGNRWYPAPPIGWPAILALGEFFGAGWLVNPILGGINIVLIYILLRSLYNRRTARIAVVLLCLSPWYIFMAMNYMTHTFTLTTALISALGVVRSRQTGQARWAWLAGFALGAMSLIRPLEGIIWALLLGLWAIGIGGKRLKFTSTISMILGAILIGGLVLPYNQALTGKATSFPINLHTDERFGVNSNAYGFGPDRGMGWPIDPYKGHSPIDGLINANLNTFSINLELFGWSIGSLLLLAIKLFSGSYNKNDLLMISVIAAIFTAFFFYYFSGGPDFGARYWFLMIVPLVVLSVRGIQILENKFAIEQLTPEFDRTHILFAVSLLSIMAMINFFPWRAIDKYFHYLGMRPDIRYLSRDNNFDNSLVLIRGDEHPDFASAFVYNPLDFNSSATVYAWDRNAEVRNELIKAFPDKQVWTIDGPTITNSGYTITDGPFNMERTK